ncbi:cache domain-containing sensor histidine kinase [Cohnella nanjingensis]|uniref:Sensor histidine kinase n=1 Tax=Cohnella nanjingensis TaxID=1387779 RepID=A0A7X0RPJ9_9BACL|nr:sensor histidine kinase [Cohnella nanjingensis]MBB6671313.1 sensor histidine kinase [Cohnella nanjingensis]
MSRLAWHHRLTDPYLNLSMRGKLFILFLLVSILPLVFFVYYSYVSVKDQLIRQTYTSMSLATSQISSNLQNKLNNYNKISASLYLDATLQQYLIRSYDGSSDYLDAYRYIDNVMNNVMTTNPEVNGVVIYSTNPHMPLDDTFIKRLDDAIREKPWFDLVQKTYGNVIFTITPAQPAEPPRKATPPMFTLVRFLNYNSLNFPYGILTIDVKESDLYALMGKEDQNKDIFIVNENGVIVSCKNKDLLNTRLGVLLPDDFKAGRSGKYQSLYQGEKVLVVYDTTPNGWKTVSIVPYSGFTQSARTSANRILVIASFCIALCIVLIYLVARLSTKRIESLLKTIRRLEREDFDLEMIPMGHDEIGQMSFALRKMGQRFKNLINEVYKKEIAKQEADMNTLQAQINPHFLYNTLASISALAMKHRDPKIKDMVAHLAKFYRISLNQGKSLISLNEELKLTRYYLSIQQIRYEDLLHLHFQIDESVLVHHTIKLTLQPFVENCIHHAVWDDERGLNIVIRAYREGEDILLDVVDDGMGMTRERLERIRAGDAVGYGIGNVDGRIKLAFGEAYGVSYYSRLGIGTMVRIRLPAGGAM